MRSVARGRTRLLGGGVFFCLSSECCNTTVVEGTSCEVPVGIVVAISDGISSPENY